MVEIAHSDAVNPTAAPMASSFDSNRRTVPGYGHVIGEWQMLTDRWWKLKLVAYLQSEIRKAEARAATAESSIEQKRIKDEARAIELRKREEAKVEQDIRAAEVKADKIVANAKEEAIKMMAYAAEECEKGIADSHTQAERAKAEREEMKRREIAELKDRAEQMKITGELPFYEKEKKGMGTKVKHALACHHGA